jgi:hypothetical protein
LGVLLHTGALLRHHIAVLATNLEYQSLLTDFGQICRGNGGVMALLADEAPQVPRPMGAQSCPICLGLVAQLALPSPDAAAISAVTPTAVQPSLHVHGMLVHMQVVRPFARGPPPLI